MSIIATGWTAFERRLFQDDAYVLLLSFSAPGGLWEGLTQPITSATRRLQGAPYALALASGAPLLFLRITGELLTLGIALMAAALARQALRLDWHAAFVAAALTVTASSDWLTASLVALGYHLAIFLYLLGAYALVRWSASGRWGWLVAAVIVGNASLWTIDAAAPLHPFTPLLALLACEDDAARRRAVRGGLLWVASALPYYALLLGFLTDTAGYAAAAIVDAPWLTRLHRAADLIALNFAPWRWASARPEWYATPAPTFSFVGRFALVALGVAIAACALLWLRRAAAVGRASDGGPRVYAARLALLLCFVALANAPYAAIHLSEIHYRTHLQSRVWASLALSLVYAAITARRARWTAMVGDAAVLAFVAFGLLGSLERQDYFTAYARRHRSELTSIAAAVPAVDARAQVLLRVPPHPTYAATEALYLARSWLALLTADPSLECRTFLLAPGRGARCETNPDALVCQTQDGSRCFPGQREQRMVLPYDRLIVLSYDAPSGIYQLESHLPEELLPAGPATAEAQRAYTPAALVRNTSPSWLARDLLDLKE